jgi:hypothetical protein
VRPGILLYNTSPSPSRDSQHRRQLGAGVWSTNNFGVEV